MNRFPSYGYGPGLSRRSALALAGAGLGAVGLGLPATAGAEAPAGVSALLNRAVDEGAVPGLVALIGQGGAAWVHAAGQRLLEASAPMRRDTVFAVASIGKPLTAVAALMLVEDGVLDLDDPVDPWLPELSRRRVLRRLDGALDETQPAERPITLRDLLSMRMGLGVVFVDPAATPVLARMQALDLAPGPRLFGGEADAFMAGIGSLPLIDQPGTRWRYHSGLDIAGVLVARAAGMSLGAFQRERLFGPLGMVDTGFQAPADRLAGLYARDAQTGAFQSWNAASGASFSEPPRFEAGGSGHVSTVDDFHAFGRFLLDGGRAGGQRLLSSELVAEMLRDQITPEQKAASPWFPGDFWDSHGWGLGIALRTDAQARGRFGWWGGFGTAFWCDPASDRVAALFTPRLMTSPDDTALPEAFITAAFDAA